MVRPIDVQQTILQTSSVEKVQQLQQQQSGAQQDYLGLQLKAKKALASKKVQDSSASEKPEIKEREKKAERHGHPSERRNGQARNHDVEKSAPEMDAEFREMGRFIDIKV